MLLGEALAGSVVRLLDGSYGIVMYDDHCPRWAVPVDFWDAPAGLVDRTEVVCAFSGP